jgi:hypothetical protein
MLAISLPSPLLSHLSLLPPLPDCNPLALHAAFDAIAGKAQSKYSKVEKNRVELWNREGKRREEKHKNGEENWLRKVEQSRMSVE